MSDPERNERTPVELPRVAVREAADGGHALELEIEIDAPIAEVWKALSEAEGLRRWFPLDARVEPGEGGSVWLSWGPGCEGKAPIVAWEPERRLRWDEGATQVELALAAEKGGAVQVRLVQSGFAGEGWEGYLDAVRRGWLYFLFNLRHYLEHHRGTPRDLLWQRRPAGRGRDEVWQALLGSEGLGTDAGEAGIEAGPISVELGSRHAGLVVLAERPHVLAIVLDDLQRALLFVELEMGGEGWHCGIWLSTWGLGEAQLEELRGAVDDLARRLLEPAPA